MGLKMWSKIETNRMQLLDTLSPQHNAKVTKMFKDPVGGGGAVLIPITVVWGAIVDQVHNHLELAEQYSVEWAKHCTWKGRGIIVI